MVKIQTTFHLPVETIKVLDLVKHNLMKSRNWVLEKSIYQFSGNVDKFLKVNEELKEYLRIKKDSWKDDMRNDMLKYHLRKGFILKNSIKKIFQMIQSNVNVEHIEKSIIAYEGLCTDSEYLSILKEIKLGIMTNKNFDINSVQEKVKINFDVEMIRDKINRLGRSR